MCAPWRLRDGTPAVITLFKTSEAGVMTSLSITRAGEFARPPTSLWGWQDAQVAKA